VRTLAHRSCPRVRWPTTVRCPAIVMVHVVRLSRAHISETKRVKHMVSKELKQESRLPDLESAIGFVIRSMVLPFWVFPGWDFAHSDRNWPFGLVNVVNGSVGTVTSRHHTGHRGGPAIVTSHIGWYLVLLCVHVCFCNSSVSKIAPQLPVDQIRPGVLFMAVSARGDHSYRGVVLTVEGRKVCSLSGCFLQQICSLHPRKSWDLSVMFSIALFVPSVLWRCWLGVRKGIRLVKNLGGFVGGGTVSPVGVAPTRTVGASASIISLSSPAP